MARLKTTFRKSAEAIASFSFEDIATGLGIVVFFGIASEESGGVDYHLITKEQFAQPRGTSRSSQGTTTIDFDSSAFNLQRTAKGTATLSCAIACTDGESVKVLVRLKKVSGSTETNITSEITSQTFTAATPILSQVVFIELPITETTIKQGDFLRLTVKLNQVNAPGTADLGHDPKNRDYQDIDITGDKTTTIMELHVPFKIQI